MRELKFRIWDRQAKAWAENDCSLHCFSNWQIDPFTGKLTDFVGAIDGDRETRYNANPALDYYWSDGQIVNEPQYVVMQYTGMKDKNGKEIYEGDIVTHTSINGKDYKAEIVFSPTLAAFVLDTSGRHLLDDKYGDYYELHKDHSYEIIGNIFETPELLEQ